MAFLPPYPKVGYSVTQAPSTLGEMREFRENTPISQKQFKEHLDAASKRDQLEADMHQFHNDISTHMLEHHLNGTEPGTDGSCYDCLDLENRYLQLHERSKERFGVHKAPKLPPL